MELARIIKRKQILLVTGGLSGFLTVLILGMWLTDPERGKPTASDIQKDKSKELTKDYRITSESVISAEENWIALSGKQMSEMKLENNELKQKLAELSSKLDTFESKKEDFHVTSPLPAVDSKNELPPLPLAGTDRMDRSKTNLVVPINEPKTAVSKNKDNSKDNAKDNELETDNRGIKISSGIEVIDLSEERPLGELKKKKNNISHFLPAGSFAKVVLISGIDAPTGGLAQKNPLPVLMKLLEHGRLPNYFKSRIKDCHATGAASGDISSERACIRLEKLACVLENGDVIEIPIQGFVAGEDGKNCFRGTLVSKQGSLIAKAALAGVFSGIGQSVAQQYQQIATSALGSVRTIDPHKAGEAGLATGASNALEKIADFYLARANETYPIIEIDANRRGELVLTNGVDLENELIKNEDSEKENKE